MDLVEYLTQDKNTTINFDLKSLNKLLVNRTGDIPESNMTTASIEDIVYPNQIYQFKRGQGLVLVPEEEEELTRNHIRNFRQSSNLPSDLKYTTFYGEWDRVPVKQDGVDNMFGDNGRLIIDTAALQMHIPVEMATEEKLSYFGCHLLKDGDMFEFQSDRPLGVYDTHLGENYLKDYVMKKGVGFFLEYHSFGHFHEPKDANCRGSFLLAREVGGPSNRTEYHITSFMVPYGFALYTEEGAIHNDSPTIGNWRVAFTNPKEYSTVTILNKQNKLLELTFGQ
jgi:hypothetical protein